jgi:hypothetical protein
MLSYDHAIEFDAFAPLNAAYHFIGVVRKMATNGAGVLVASAGPDGQTEIFDETYANGDTGNNGDSRDRRTCNERRPDNAARCIVELVEVPKGSKKELKGKVIRLYESAADGSTGPESGDIVDLLPTALYPIKNDNNGAWGLGSTFVVDVIPQADDEYEKRGWSAFVAVSSHIWCCHLKSESRRVIPPTPAEMKAIETAQRISAIADRFKHAVVEAESHGLTMARLAADPDTAASFTAFKTALEGADEVAAGQALGRFETAIQRLIPSGIKVKEMTAIADTLPDSLADLDLSAFGG